VTGKARIVLIDDHPIVLFGLRNLVAAESDFEIVGEASCGGAGLELVRAARPDLAIVDISMSDLSGLVLAQRLREEKSPARLLALTVHEDRSYVSAALQAGIRGYIVKRSVTDNLVPAMRAVLAGAVYVDRSILEPVLYASAAVNAAPAGAAARQTALTEREAQVLKLVAAGHSNKQIASDLDIGVKSVETYKARGVEKLGLRTRADIVRYGVAQGWLAT
jgi:DNA-binding NarL/FixJ family response regulator